MAGRHPVAYFNFADDASHALTLRVALSAVSTEGALRNLRAETDGQTFEQLCDEARNVWDEALSVLRCEGTADQCRMLYTSLYHTMINPSIYMDVDRQYRGLDGNIHTAQGFDHYTVFSLWDTYRAQHPLLALFQPERNAHMARSMLAHQQQSVHHLLPIWSLMGNEGWCMTGYHAVSVLADALAKGADLPRDAVLRAMVSTASSERMSGMKDYLAMGYVPFDRDQTAASNTLEYAYDDWAIYATAQAAGDTATARAFAQRAQSYRNVYNPASGFACPRYADGRFKADMDPYQA